eukprot:CAMPEP_0198339448 /NCGR_PEP_ID=MMETSP1450-20131203/40078_1 /TAXON_ID=753684 ORGANISM="Madagascaria erythrocladiodes, Strain CCMP3234" /NCGR_SAMPLE_ID=MMETSP1450 /ASSEMBLY_ACC=CAM_ASM_001115 /LENGTH=57 /DNA_ID=CAMNT_0044044377 /DNA_START=61 /DNA_END=230 /DNA_ORIENTATION=-
MNIAHVGSVAVHDGVHYVVKGQEVSVAIAGAREARVVGARAQLAYAETRAAVTPAPG